MTPAKLNLTCPQGATFSKQFTYKIDGQAVDLTGYTARMQVRESYASTTKVLDLSSPDDITIGDGAGTVVVTIDAESTAAVRPRTYVYDLELVTGSTVYRLLEGKFIVTPEVTR